MFLFLLLCFQNSPIYENNVGPDLKHDEKSGDYEVIEVKKERETVLKPSSTLGNRRPQPLPRTTSNDETSVPIRDRNLCPYANCKKRFGVYVQDPEKLVAVDSKEKI